VRHTAVRCSGMLAVGGGAYFFISISQMVHLAALCRAVGIWEIQKFYYQSRNYPLPLTRTRPKLKANTTKQTKYPGYSTRAVKSPAIAPADGKILPR
jgi:hypothetical protein